MKVNKNAFLLILIIASLNNLSAQKGEIVLDTIYDKYLAWKGHYLLIGKQQESILIKGDSIKPYPVHVDKFKAGNLGVPLIQVDKRCYLLNDELDFDSTKYVDLDLQITSDHCVYGNKIAYVKGNSVFIANFDTHKTDFALQNAGVFTINEQYIWIQRMSTDEDFIYDLETKKLSKLPSDFKFPKTDHPYFILNAPLDENIHVIDLKLRDAISPSEGYTDYYIQGNLLIVYGKRKPIKVFYKNKLLDLEEEYVDVVCNYYSSLCFLTNLADKISVLSPKGEFLTEAIFDNSLNNSFQDKDIISIKKGDSLQVYNRDFKQILEGKYEEVRYVDENRLLVKKDRRYKVIDVNNSEIIASLPFIPNYMNVLTAFGPKLLFAYNGTLRVLYDYNGSEIVRWTNQKGDKFANSGKIFSALSLSMIKALSSEQEARINPLGMWVWRERKGRTHIEFLCNKSGKKLSNNFKRMILLQTPGQYLIRTLSKKIGIIKIEK